MSQWWSDIAGLIAFAAFGLWWIAFPRSVIRFYSWFHRGRIRLPRAAVVRVAGALYVTLLIVVWWLQAFRRQ